MTRRSVELVVARGVQHAGRRRRRQLEGGGRRSQLTARGRRRYVVVAGRRGRQRVLRGVAATLGRVRTVPWRVQRRRLQLVIGRLYLKQVLVVLGVRVAFPRLGLPFARFPFSGGTTTRFLGTAAELVAMEIGSHRSGST